MAYRNTGSQSVRQTRAGQSHRHQVIDVKELIKKGGGVPEPQCHDILDLTNLLERTINVFSKVIDSALGRKHTALGLLRDRSPFPDNYNFPNHYGRLQPHPPSSNHDLATEVDLIWLFSIFNAIFFMNTLPSNTFVSRQDSSSFDLGRRVNLLEQRGSIFASSPGSAFVDNFGAGFKRRDDHQFLPPTIAVLSSHIDLLGTEQVVPWEDQVGSLLGSMIDLFIRYYSCRKDGCWNDKYTHGKMHRGEVWQVIAYRFETSPTMRRTQEALGSPINLRRKEDYEWELNHWNLRELDSLENMLVRRRIETWGWAPDSQLTCVKAVQERKRNRAMALDEESRAMNELIDSHFQSGTRESRFEGMQFHFGGPQHLFEDRGSRFGAGRYVPEAIFEQGESRSRAAPSRSRRPENRTEPGESRYGGSQPRSGEDGSRSERMRSLFRRSRGE